MSRSVCLISALLVLAVPGIAGVRATVRCTLREPSPPARLGRTVGLNWEIRPATPHSGQRL